MPILKAFTESVSIEGGASADTVRDLSIRRSASERVTQCEFTVENIPAQAGAFAAAVLGKEVTATITAEDGAAVAFTGYIVSVEAERGSNWTQKRIRAHSLEARAKYVRLRGEWEAVAVSAILQEIWSTYGGTAAPGGLAIDSNSDELDLTAKFDSLYELTEEVARRTAWAWEINNAGVFRFFDPIQETSPAYDQGDADIEGGTLRVSRDAEQLINVARAQAWLYKRRNKVVQAVAADDCIKSVQAPELVPPQGWEMVGGVEIIEDFAPESLDRSANLTDDGWLEFSPYIVPEEQSAPANQEFVEVQVEAQWRKQVWVMLEDGASIAEFGRREGQPLGDDGGQTVEDAREQLAELLERRARPVVEVRGNALEIGYAPDTISQVTLTDPPLSANLYVTSVDYTTQGNDVEVNVEFSSPDRVLDSTSVGASSVGGQRPTRKIDVVSEMHRRLIRLERQESHPKSVLGITTSQIGELSPAPPTREAQGWGVELSARDIGAQTESAWGWAGEASGALMATLGAVGSWGWGEAVSGAFPSEPITDSGWGWGWGEAVSGAFPSESATDSGWGWAGITTGQEPPPQLVSLEAGRGWAGETTAAAATGAGTDVGWGWSEVVTSAQNQATEQTQTGWGWAGQVLATDIRQALQAGWGWGEDVAAAQPTAADTETGWGWGEVVTAAEAQVGRRTFNGDMLNGKTFN